MSCLYTPERWTIIKLTNKATGKYHFRVVGGWSGSYLYGSSWQVSSGIKTLEDHGEYYSSLQTSGSVYRLYKQSEGWNAIMHETYMGLMANLDVEFQQVLLKDFLLFIRNNPMDTTGSS